LLLGRYVNLQTFNVVGRVSRNASTVGAALRELVSFFVLYDSGGTLSVSIHEGSVSIIFGFPVYSPCARQRQLDDQVAAVSRLRAWETRR
jgi:hypothetical protein